MKVAHITTHLNTGGIPVYIYTLIPELREHGVEQIVFSSGGSMESDFASQKIPSFFASLKTKFEFHPKVFLSLPKVIWRLKKEKIELIHAHTRVSQVFAAMIQVITGIPFVSTSHGFYQRRLGRRIFPAWGKKVIAISEPVKQELIQIHQVEPSKVMRIRNGIPLGRFLEASRPDAKAKARARWNLKPNDFVVCLVSRIIADKGAEDLLKAVQILNRYAQLKVFIVGDGPDKNDFEKKTQNWGISSQVTFTGNLANVSEILSASDAFVHPVRVSEGFGLSIAEAMATALPVIISDHWALYSLVKDRNVGRFVTKEKPEQIAAILEEWMKKPEALSEMGKNAQNAAIEFFDIKRVAAEVHQIYKAALSVPREGIFNLIFIFLKP